MFDGYLRIILVGQAIDAPIAPKIIQIGSFILDANKTIMMKEGLLANTATLETKLIFRGNKLHKGERSKKHNGSWPDILLIQRKATQD